MSLLTVEGTYRDGKVSLAEPPAGVQEARVLVTFLPTQKKSPSPQYMRFGQLRGNSDRMSDDDDFKMAEWHPKAEDLDA